MLPDPQDGRSRPACGLHVFAVPRPGPLNLGMPVGLSGLWRHVASGAPVPEAAVEEHRECRTNEDIRISRGPGVHLMRDPPSLEVPVETPLLERPPAPDPGHDVATGLLRKDVRHDGSLPIDRVVDQVSQIPEVNELSVMSDNICGKGTM